MRLTGPRGLVRHISATAFDIVLICLKLTIAGVPSLGSPDVEERSDANYTWHISHAGCCDVVRRRSLQRISDRPHWDWRRNRGFRRERGFWGERGFRREGGF